MLIIYNLGIGAYFFAIWIASLFGKKARLWIDGRKDNTYAKLQQSAWFHFASLGEFEQGRPVLEAYKAQHPGKKIVITFFSPSGYEVKKDTPLADAVYYLPLDTAANARKFIDAIDPDIAIFTKYEYWYHFFHELRRRKIPLYIISGIFRRDQVFFKWYGSLHRRMLRCVTWFFVQSEASKELLEESGRKNITVSGDTRFDRVWAGAQQPKLLPYINEFKNGHKVFIAGSTWPADEKILAKLPAVYPAWKFIIAPHEINGEKIERLISLLPAGSAIRYSQLSGQHPSIMAGDYKEMQTLIIDNIGMLSALYHYADIAYIGGGFGAGIHNTLEAAAFGLPVIFGPNYRKFKEARELMELKAAFSINSEAELKSALYILIDKKDRYRQASKAAAAYVAGHTGATKIIMDQINA
jgi:3-deoxy-D-manno-octulosonic-acid transferase